MPKLRYKTLILSDVHLGTPDCKIDEVNHLLANIHCEKLILNGDIIDGWRLRRSGRWTKAHSRFVRLVLKKLEKRDTRVVYLRGNHDDILSRFLPLAFENLRVEEEYIHHTAERRYLVLHGDVFDCVTKHMVVISHLGDIGYKWLLRLNRAYNRWRAWRGREYFSLSKYIKGKVKTAVSFVSHYEKQISLMARDKNCTGVICGHIHTPADKYFDGIHYLNSGDWVESLTAIVEQPDGSMEVIDYADFKRKLSEINQPPPETLANTPFQVLPGAKVVVQ